FIRTNVGRFVVEKKPSGRTPSAGAGTNRASGAFANFGWEKSGGGKVVTPSISRDGYSSRNASTGSTCDARRAGRYAASSATIASTVIDPASVVLSVGFTPNRKLAMS